VVERLWTRLRGKEGDDDRIEKESRSRVGVPSETWQCSQHRGKFVRQNRCERQLVVGLLDRVPAAESGKGYDLV